MKNKILEYNAIFQKEQKGGYSVWIPTLPGCTSQGETFEETVENIKEAITLYLEDKPEEREDGMDIHNQFMAPISVAI